MKTMHALRSLMVCLLTSFLSMALADQKALLPKYNEAEIKARYDVFLLGLDYVKVATDYPKVIKDLLSNDSAKQVAAVKTLGETGEPAVIAFWPCV